MYDAQVAAWLLRRGPGPVRVERVACDRALVIVETRPVFWLPYVIASAVRAHPGWALYVFGSPAVHAMLTGAVHGHTAVTLDCGRITSQQYSHLLFSAAFWDVIREEHVLLFQTDSVVVRPVPEAALRYDYIGALCGELHPDRFVMNGGLSLRRRSAMRRAIALLTDADRDSPEDVAFCRVMRAAGDFALPSMAECDAFAIESQGDPRTAVGMHGTDKYYAPPALVRELLDGGLDDLDDLD